MPKVVKKKSTAAPTSSSSKNTAKASPCLRNKYVSSVFPSGHGASSVAPCCRRLGGISCFRSKELFTHKFQINHGSQVEFHVDIAVCLFPLTHAYLHEDRSVEAGAFSIDTCTESNEKRYYLEFDLLFSRQSAERIFYLYKAPLPGHDDGSEKYMYKCCMSHNPQDQHYHRKYIHYRDLIRHLYDHDKLSVDHLGPSQQDISKIKANGEIQTNAKAAQQLTEAIGLATSLTNIWRRQWNKIRPRMPSAAASTNGNTQSEHCMPVTQHHQQEKQEQSTPSSDNNNLDDVIDALTSSTLRDLDMTSLHERLAPGVQLQTHQEYGVKWMFLREELPYFNVRGGIVADTMGSGKSLQTLALIVAKPNSTRSCGDESSLSTSDTACINLIVCKLSLLHQWIDEIHKFFPRQEDFMDIFVAHKSVDTKKASPNRVNGLAWSKIDESSKDSRRVTLLLTTYDQIRAWHQTQTQQRFLQQEYFRIVLDEGHCIATASSATAIAISSLRAKFRWVLSGSPYRNSPRDLYSLAVLFLKLQDSFLDDERFGRKARWNRAFTRMDAIRQFEDTGVIPKFNLSALSIRDEARIECWLQVLLLRRTHDDQGSVTLPERINHDHVCDLNGDSQVGEKAIYGHVKNAVEQFVLHELGETFTFTSVHGGVMLLRRICVSIDLLLRNDEDGAAMWQGSDTNATTTILERPIKHLTKHHLLKALPGPLKVFLNNHRADKRQMSSKYSLVKDTISSIMKGKYGTSGTKATCHKVVVFSQWSGALDLMEDLVKSYFVASFVLLRIDGATPGKERMKQCALFNGTTESHILLLNYKAAGEGLNLQKGQHVFLLDPWFTPSVEDQAIARVYRQGNTNSKTHVHRFIVERSIEQRVQQISDRKREESERLLSIGLIHRAKAVQNTIDFSKDAILHLLQGSRS